MSGEEMKRKIWNEINEYCTTIGRGEKPAFIVLHPAAVHAIELEYWQNPKDILYSAPRGLSERELVFGVPLIRCAGINEDEILLGITPLQKRKI